VGKELAHGNSVPGNRGREALQKNSAGTAKKRILNDHCLDLSPFHILEKV
jgi:hypothetical protein